MKSFQQRVKNKYTVVVVEAGFQDIAKKSALVLMGLLFAGKSSAFTGTGLKEYAAQTTKDFSKSGVDCVVDAKVKAGNSDKQTATLTYTCMDGSGAGIVITKDKTGSNNAVNLKLVKNKEGYIDPEVETIATRVAKELHRLLLAHSADLTK